MKIIATMVVILPRKVPGPLLPKTVWLEPPKTAPMLAPFPACSSTVRIRTIQTITCNIMTRICTCYTPRMLFIPYNLQERCCIQTGPSDQRPVDVLLEHQLGDILRRDASPVA